MASETNWVRPLDKVPFPNVWANFTAKESRNSDKLVNYRIQDLPADRIDDAVDHMTKYFVRDEPISDLCDGAENNQYVEDLQGLFRGCLLQNMTLVIMQEGSDEILAMNVNYVVSKTDTFLSSLQLKDKHAQQIFEIIDICVKEHDVFKTYGVDNCLESFGLSVVRSHRGLGFGEKLLRARKPICEAFGIKITQTLFTSDISSRIADLVGFKIDVEYTYAELMQINPTFNFDNIKSKKVALKSWRFE